MHVKEYQLSPADAFDPARLQAVLQALVPAPQRSSHVATPLRRSIDARGKMPVVTLQVAIQPRPQAPVTHRYQEAAADAPRVVIVGAGPAGLFAALRLLEVGVKPIVLERGKDVRARRRDLAAINKAHVVNPESNYCFGEGGAGTYSDGKLYTRSKKRGDIRKILEVLVAHGATEEILFDAHPHIGTNKLPPLVAQLRETIRAAGGEVHFETRLEGFKLSNGRIRAAATNRGDVEGEAFILATGHSARDVFELLHRQGIRLEAKPFALGVRIEHPQALIDRLQYHCQQGRDRYLPAASYSLVHQAAVDGHSRGVFSFCMCPGGFIVPAATAPGEIVVNGMSPSRRDSVFANSGLVVAVEPSDFKEFAAAGPLAGLYFQQAVEQAAWRAGGETQTAPAQRMTDFLRGRVSASLPATSYQPGLRSVDLRSVLPPFLSDALRQGLTAFGQKMRGYLTEEAQLVGVESRTSSPVRIPRNPATLEHIEIGNLFPCGEGAGYAGGIVSAAMDGERCAVAALAQIKRR